MAEYVQLLQYKGLKHWLWVWVEGCGGLNCTQYYLCINENIETRKKLYVYITISSICKFIKKSIFIEYTTTTKHMNMKTRMSTSLLKRTVFSEIYTPALLETKEAVLETTTNVKGMIQSKMKRSILHYILYKIL